MPSWTHVIATMRGQWLPGDERGFRDHGHRIHSSGDYRTPPPRDEHAGLRAYARSLARDAVSLTPPQRVLVGTALVAKLRAMNVPCAVLACGSTHTHALIRVGELDAKPVLGRAKQAASYAVRTEIPGKMWGGSSGVVRIGSVEHWTAAFWYIARHRREGAWVWFDGEFLRKARGRRRTEAE